ncbi:MAG: hypothetical protein CME63_13305 [Halobacteriovoraceae bacterium]|nr:hypothetical protein [Halobacteriovoraceae bacterium]MBC98720.1 hypothetical protein [Halobacteriovoraceae bacterium]
MSWDKALQSKAIKIGDYLEFVTSDGRNARFRLNRKVIKLTLKRNQISKFTTHHIYLPAIHQVGEYELRWDEQWNCYRFKGCSGSLFIHNRACSESSLILEGDELSLDYNLIRVKRVETIKKKQDFSFRWPEGVPILLEGETGTGKSSLARKLHHLHVGEDKPFVGINLSSLNPSLIESELFGHERGAFTGAIRDKLGAVELAKGGTLFLDEMDSLDRSMQVKLLTFLDDLRFRRVGGEKELQTNCRLIFATGRCLKSLVERDQFRADLLYRICSGVVEKLPALREKPELIVREVSKFASERHLFIDQKLIELYQTCLWPGNYRQLHSHLQRKEMIHYKKRRLGVCLLDHELERKGFDETLEHDSLDEMKRFHCRKIYLESHGNMTVAAQRLQISKNTLKKIMD